jgi:hypothetical protein
MLIRRCAKPDKKEYQKYMMATGMGFIVMGFLGFFVKVRNIWGPNGLLSSDFSTFDACWYAHCSPLARYAHAASRTDLSHLGSSCSFPSTTSLSAICDCSSDRRKLNVSRMLTVLYLRSDE